MHNKPGLFDDALVCALLKIGGSLDLVTGLRRRLLFGTACMY